jgi:hypothetical protein
MLNLSGQNVGDLRQFAQRTWRQSFVSLRALLMRNNFFPLTMQPLGRLFVSTVFVSTLGCAMFEEENQPKYTRNSPSSVTRHAPAPTEGKDQDPNDFLRRQRPKP